MMKRVLSIIGILLLHYTFCHAGLEVKRPDSPGLEDGLVGYWSFNEPDISGTTVYDRSGQGNNGTMVNSPLKVIGKQGQALSFDGDDAYVMIGNPASLQIAGDITICCWFYSIGGSHFMVSKSNGSNRDYGFYHSGAGYLGLYFGSTNVGSDPYLFPDNTWTHGCVSVSGSDASFYANGAYLNTKSGVTISNNNRSLAIGHDGPNAGWPFNGNIDEVRIYNRALAADEIERLYNIGKGAVTAAPQQAKLTTGLVGYWPFNGPDISGNTAYDRSGQGNHGTMVSGPLKVIGTMGQALSFNGANYVETPVIPYFDPYSISFWLKTFATSNTALGWSAYRFCMVSGTGVVLCTNNGDSGQGPGSSIVVNDNNWHHVVFENSSSNMTLYVDGAYQNSYSHSPQTANDSLRMGMRNFGGYFTGFLDEVRLYDRALSADEVKALYNQAASKYQASQQDQLTTGLVGYWPFNGPDISGTTAYDRSGNGNHGTIYGAATTPIEVASDNFNRSDGGLGSNWTTVTGTANPVIKSNKVNLADESSGLHCAYWNANSFNSNQYAQATFPNIPNGTNYGPAVAVRLSNERGYILWWGNSQDTVSIWRMDNSGSWTELQGASGLTIANTDVWRLEAVGSSLRGYQNGNLVVGATDGTYTGGSPGIWLYYPVNQLDDWAGGNVISGTGDVSFGKVGQGLRFDGNNDYVSLGTSLDPPLPFTVSAWVRPTDYSFWRTIVCKRDSWSPGETRWHIYLNVNDGKVRVQNYVNTLDSSYVPPLNQWTHLVVIVGSNSQLFVNGILNESLGSFTLDTDATAAVNIGASNADGSDDQYYGLMDEVRVYNRALSAEEIKRLYNMGR